MKVAKPMWNVGATNRMLLLTQALTQQLIPALGSSFVYRKVRCYLTPVDGSLQLPVDFIESQERLMFIPSRELAEDTPNI